MFLSPTVWTATCCLFSMLPGSVYLSYISSAGFRVSYRTTVLGATNKTIEVRALIPFLVGMKAQLSSTDAAKQAVVEQCRRGQDGLYQVTLRVQDPDRPARKPRGAQGPKPRSR